MEAFMGRFSGDDVRAETEGHDDFRDDERRESDHASQGCLTEDCPYCEPDYREKGY
jgi:hypothetical protein